VSPNTPQTTRVLVKSLVLSATPTRAPVFAFDLNSFPLRCTYQIVVTGTNGAVKAANLPFTDAHRYLPPPLGAEGNTVKQYVNLSPSTPFAAGDTVTLYAYGDAEGQAITNNFFDIYY